VSISEQLEKANAHDRAGGPRNPHDQTPGYLFGHTVPRSGYRLHTDLRRPRLSGGMRAAKEPLSVTDADTLNRHPLPLARLMGIEFREAGRDRVVAEMTVRDDLCTAGERVHGGALMALADTAAAMGTAMSLPDGASGTTTI